MRWNRRVVARVPQRVMRALHAARRPGGKSDLSLALLDIASATASSGSSQPPQAVRAVATRYDKLAAMFLGAILAALTLINLR